MRSFLNCHSAPVFFSLFRAQCIKLHSFNTNPRRKTNSMTVADPGMNMFHILSPIQRVNSARKVQRPNFPKWLLTHWSSLHTLTHRRRNGRTALTEQRGNEKDTETKGDLQRVEGTQFGLSNFIGKLSPRVRTSSRLEFDLTREERFPGRCETMPAFNYSSQSFHHLQPHRHHLRQRTTFV